MCLQVSRASSGPLHMDSSFTLVYSRLPHTHRHANNKATGRRDVVLVLPNNLKFSLEVLGVLGQRHLYDVERVVVVFLRGQQQSQQVEGVDVVPLELQRLPNIA